jgi:hypothetical protein
VNDSRVQGRFEDAHTFFSESVILLVPGDVNRTVGRDAMLDSYRQFTEKATVHEYRETNLNIDLFGSTAIAQLGFSIRYEIEGNTSDESGMDIYVLAKSNDQWLIEWRTQVPRGQSPIERTRVPKRSLTLSAVRRNRLVIAWRICYEVRSCVATVSLADGNSWNRSSSAASNALLILLRNLAGPISGAFLQDFGGRIYQLPEGTR